jgi:glycosyltransferase involved in cell wall biosynthesis
VGDGGLIVPARDPRAFADACTTLLLNDALRGRLAAAGRRRAHEMFTIDRLVNDFRAVYDDVARRYAQSPVPAPRSPLRLARSSEAR